MAFSDWTIIRRSMTARLFSSATTALLVGVAVALLLVLLMLRASAPKAFERGTGNMHLLITAEPSPLESVLKGVFLTQPPRRSIEWAKFQSLQSSLTTGQSGYAIPTQLGDSYRGLHVLATTREFFEKFEPNPGEPWSFRSGKAFERAFDLVLGAEAARATGLKVGDTLSLTHGTEEGGHVHDEFKHTVVGVLGATGSAFDRALIGDLRGAWIIHAFDKREREHAHDDHAEHGEDEHAHDEHDEHDEHGEHGHDEHDHDEHAHEPPMSESDLTDADRLVTGVFVRLQTREGSDVAANLPQVFDQLRRDTSITVASPRQEIDRLFRTISNIDTLFIAMAVVVVVCSGVAIMLALYNSMEQRRRQIAVLRVLGASRARVFGLILTESVLLGVLGTLLGVALAFVGARGAGAVIRRMVGVHIDAQLPPRTLVVVALGTLALACLAGVIPGVMAYRTSVAKNLRPLG